MPEDKEEDSSNEFYPIFKQLIVFMFFFVFFSKAVKGVQKHA